MSRLQSATTRLISLIAAAASLAACAHSGEGLAAAPTEQPANARALLYAACAAEGGSAGAVSRVGRYVRLTCTGAPARALYDAAETFSRSRGRETVEGGVTVRRIGAEPWFDACRREREAYSCFVHLLSPKDFLDADTEATPTGKSS